MISIDEFLTSIEKNESGLYLFASRDIVVYDDDTQTLYIPSASYNNANMNAVGDFRTHIGHHLLWSRHTDIDCSSGELGTALYNNGYDAVTVMSNKDFQVLALKKTNLP